MSLQSEEKTTNSNSSEIIHTEDVEEGIFKLIKTTQDEFIAFGNYRMPKYDTIEEHIRRIKEKDWKTILDVMVIMIDINNKRNPK